MGDNGSFWSEGKSAINGMSDEHDTNPFYHTRGDTIGSGINNIPFNTEVVKAGIATLAVLAVPVGPGVDEIADNERYAPILCQNRPNPFFQGTTISYALPGPSGERRVILSIYNLSGELIRTLVNDARSPGCYNVYWDGKDNSGNRALPGTYFYCLETGNFKATKKLIILR